ncbi:MAG: orotidine-5'-phosphate decarboxylase [Bacteroidetes bacterium]|nr:MAG: orotidine-5'-phosphate decarboxylase [Bacteroidota bacterium]
MNRSELVNSIKEKRSFLCVGLDPDLDKLPPHLLNSNDPIFEFNRQIIDATKDYCVAYKPNIAFYECYGIDGWKALQKTIDYIPKSHFTIADGKRGDIGNTSRYYAKTFFEQLHFDSVTVAPYMGEDSVRPFLEFEGKWAIILALTSNKGANDFQFSQLEKEQKPLFEKVLDKCMEWGTADNLMFVTGATRPKDLGHIRDLVPEHFLLIPGVGAQGGDLQEVAEQAFNKDCGMLVNSSRGIIYASAGADFAEKAGDAARQLQQQMEAFLKEKSFI